MAGRGPSDPLGDADFYEKGRYGGWLYKLIVAPGWILAVGLLGWVGITTGTPDVAGIPYLVLGFVLCSAAKISQFRRGRWVSFGADMTDGMSWLAACSYLLGYLLMIAGFIIVFWD